MTVLRSVNRRPPFLFPLFISEILELVVNCKFVRRALNSLQEFKFKVFHRNIACNIFAVIRCI